MSFWRVGTKCARNLYENDIDVGRCDDPKVAARIVVGMNERSRDDSILRCATDLVEAAEEVCSKNRGSSLYEGLGQAAKALRLLLEEEPDSNPPVTSRSDRSDPKPPSKGGSYTFDHEPSDTLPPIRSSKDAHRYFEGRKSPPPAIQEKPMSPPEQTPPMGRRPLTESGAKRSLIVHYRRSIGEEKANIRTCDEEIAELKDRPDVVRYLEAVEAKRVSTERLDQAAKDLGLAVAGEGEGAINPR